MCNEVCQPSKRALPYATKAEHKFPSKKMQVQILYVKLQTWVSYRRKLQKMRQNMSKKGISHPSLPVQPAVPDSTYASSPGSCRRNGKQNLPTNSASQTEQCYGALLCLLSQITAAATEQYGSLPAPSSFHIWTFTSQVQGLAAQYGYSAAGSASCWHQPEPKQPSNTKEKLQQMGFHQHLHQLEFIPTYSLMSSMSVSRSQNAEPFAPEAWVSAGTWLSILISTICQVADNSLHTSQRDETPQANKTKDRVRPHIQRLCLEFKYKSTVPLNFKKVIKG